MKNSKLKIKLILDKLYARYNHRRLIKSDPLQFVYHYSNKADMEIAAFLASALAYGNVKQIEKSLNRLLALMSKSPYQFIKNFNRQNRSKLKNFKHRFTSGDDISDLLTLFKKVLTRFGSIENFFVQFYSPDDKNIIPALLRFCDSLLQMHDKAHKARTSKGVSYLLPSPAKASACKRLNLFLRWMVRNDDVDTGLWKSVDKAKLIVPVDVHMARLCRILGFHNHKTATLSTALKITERFAEIEPSDPVKYDFALSRVGILQNCTGRHRAGCEFCELFKICSNQP